jgi:glycosyltransferase involved in cell wall biosynthesis
MSTTARDSGVEILIATPTVFVGDGQSRVNLELSRELTARGHRVTVLAGRVDEELLRRHGIAWQRLPAMPNAPALLRDVLWSRRATAWLRRNADRFDVLHLNGASAFIPHHVNTCHFVHGSFRRQLAADADSAGVRGGYHRAYSEVNFRAERRAYALARRVVAVSKKTAVELERFDGVPTRRLSVVHNGVDTEAFQPDPGKRARVRADIGIDEEIFALLFVGEVTVPRKGLSTILEAMRLLPDVIHLFVVGSGSLSPYRPLLESVARRVHFLGFRRDVPDLYATLDCFVYPTRYDACSLAVLEALAAAMPVITTRESGSGELITSGRDGIVLDRPDDAAALRRTIEMLHRDRPLAVGLGRNGRRVAEQNTWRRMAERYEAIYVDVLRGRPSGSE